MSDTGLVPKQAVQSLLPTDATSRKKIPLQVVLDYFTAALIEVKVSQAGNDQLIPARHTLEPRQVK